MQRFLRAQSKQTIRQGTRHQLMHLLLLLLSNFVVQGYLINWDMQREIWSLDAYHKQKLGRPVRLAVCGR
jgi:hypothetical protein